MIFLINNKMCLMKINATSITPYNNLWLSFQLFVLPPQKKPIGWA